MFVPNFKILGPVVPEKSLTKISIFITGSERIGKKEKWRNKGTDKQYVADSLLHDTTYHTRCLYEISKS